MLIGEEKHEMAAFTPDQERAVVLGAGWALSAVSRRLLRTSREGRRQINLSFLSFLPL